ncbi:MAG: MbnP family protein, partial [Bacteroidia bacterium]
MAILWVAMSFSFKPKQAATNCQIILTFKHVVGTETLKLDSVTYKNDLGQPFTISKFKYYLSNFHFKNAGGKDIFINESFIIDEDEDGSKQIILKTIAEGNYTSVDFIIGVDSIHNCS